MQSRKGSITEAVLNTATGFIFSMIIWRYLVAPLYDLPVDIQTNLGITCIFTVASIIRSYAWRRIFNYFHVRKLTQEFTKGSKVV